MKRHLSNFPVVTILGPRQCGKTTLIRSLIPQPAYFDLERPSDFNLISADIEGFLQKAHTPVVFDEVNRLPGLLPVLRSVVDENRVNGRFILLGSASPSLVKGVSESLAGRTSFLDMTPFLWPEIAPPSTDLALNGLWFRGGFPSAALENDDIARRDWFDAYVRAFVERDLNALGIEIDPLMMHRLLRMMAHGNGGIWNASQYGASLGLTYNTVNRYADILERTFFIRRLLPWYANIGKRLVKRPKLYFRDSGLLHYLLGISSPALLDTHPARGVSWETFALDQLMGILSLSLRPQGYYFYRTATGDEVDLLVEIEGRLLPMEFKVHSAPGSEHLKGMRKIMKQLKLDAGWVIYPGEKEYSLGNGVTVIGLRKLLASPSAFLP
ncbi:MAG: ATP-binding protein [Fibrobacterota bacterium]